MRVIIVHQHDPAIHHVGGVGTFINTFIKWAPEDCDVSLVGVSTDPEKRPVGRWQKFQVGARTIDYLPLVCAHPTYHSRFPLSVRFTWALWRHRRQIDFKNAIVELHRIEPELALLGIGSPRALFFHTHTRDLYNPKTEVFWKRFPWLYFWLERRLLKRMERMYSVREDAVAWYRERYPKLSKPFSFLPTWVDEEVFHSLPEAERRAHKKALAADEGLDPESRWLLFVGRFELQKDPFLLLDAFRDLNERMPNTQLVMVGGGSLEDAIRATIATYRLGGKVFLVSPQPQSRISRWMNAADCLCLTSAYEGMPRVVVEALRCGLPAVSFDDGEARRLLEHALAGKLVKERTPRAFSEAFAEVLSRAPDRQACQRQVEQFSASAVLEGLFSDYRLMEKQAEAGGSRAGLFGLALDNVTMAQAVQKVDHFLADGEKHYVVTANVDHIVMLQKDREFLQAYRGAALAVADGMPIVWASRLLGRPLAERVAGSDLFIRVCELCARKGYRIYFLGAEPGVALQAARNLKERFAGLDVVGTDAPLQGFDTDLLENRAVIDRINRAQPDVLCIALGAPKQEKWIARHVSELDIRVALCVGAAIDFAAGRVRRAPHWMQAAGLEWLWRLLADPRRLWRRYLVQDLAFIKIFLTEWLRSSRRPIPPPTVHADLPQESLTR